MPQIHPTTIIEGDVELAEGVTVGPHCVLDGTLGPVRVGEGTAMRGTAYLTGPLTIGENNRIYPFVCLGFAPQHAKFDSETPGEGLTIGDENTFREHVTIHRAFESGGPTVVGNRNWFMAESHAGHDCCIGDDCTFVNNSALGGHVTIEDRVIIGGSSVVHQFCRIGRGAMLTGGMGTSCDLPPHFMLTGFNLCGSVNLVGLRRSGATREEIDDVRWVYRVLYREDRTIASALECIRARADRPIVAEYVRFIEASERSICPAKPKAVRGET